MSTFKIGPHLTAQFAAIHISKTYGFINDAGARQNAKFQDAAVDANRHLIEKLWGSVPVYWDSSDMVAPAGAESLPEYICNVWLVSDSLLEKRLWGDSQPYPKGSHVAIVFFLESIDIAEMASIRSRLTRIFKGTAWSEIAKDFLG